MFSIFIYFYFPIFRNLSSVCFLDENNFLRNGKMKWKLKRTEISRQKNPECLAEASFRLTSDTFPKYFVHKANNTRILYHKQFMIYTIYDLQV